MIAQCCACGERLPVAYTLAAYDPLGRATRDFQYCAACWEARKGKQFEAPMTQDEWDQYRWERDADRHANSKTRNA